MRIFCVNHGCFMVQYILGVYAILGGFMTIKDMIDLLRVHDAAEDLKKIVEQLSGGTDYAFGYDEGVLSRLDYVNSVIRRNSPLFLC